MRLSALATLAGGIALAALTAVDANALKCPSPFKPTALNFVKGALTDYPLGAYGGLLWDNAYLNDPTIPDSGKCGYALGTPKAIFSNGGAPISVSAQLNKCLWKPLSATLNAAWWDGLEVSIGSWDAKGNYADFDIITTLSTTSKTVVDLTPLGTVYGIGFVSKKTGNSTLGTNPSCATGSNGTQFVISSFTYQGAKRRTKDAPKLYINGADGHSRPPMVLP